ncbi:MAG: ketoacyl-ACP synthase III [Spirochaetae bacterium HGW-Spirochaetae-3]|jgi:3-oxoacyl-[acyl-carrier-protein] synthase-3|nr:MAG: ketoacyl-ACP synthase III [Spirochaetae bacterium HGW-Spirochaetae-3]
MAKAKIIGTGAYAPGKSISNEEIKTLAGIDFDEVKLSEGRGIRNRHLARLRCIDESAADFAEKAARAAMADAGIGSMDPSLFIVATDTPEFISPATSMVIQGRIQGGQADCGVFDVNASCAGFVTALDAAAKMLACEPDYRYAVVVGVYNMAAHLRPGDAFGWAVFGDGAGAIVLERVPDDDPSGYVAGRLLADGTQWDYIGVYAGGARRPITHEVLESGEYGLELLQIMPGDRNIRLWVPMVRALCVKGGIPIERVEQFVFTQINKSVILDVMAELGRPASLAAMSMDRYGYTGSACVPMAFHEAVKRGDVRRGAPVVFCASGAGLAVGANLFIY